VGGRPTNVKIRNLQINNCLPANMPMGRYILASSFIPVERCILASSFHLVVACWQACQWEGALWRLLASRVQIGEYINADDSQHAHTGYGTHFNSTILRTQHSKNYFYFFYSQDVKLNPRQFGYSEG